MRRTREDRRRAGCRWFHVPMGARPVNEEREEMHHRQVDIRFYKRKDGLYEVEGRLTDIKTHAFRRQLANEDSPPGTTLHDIAVTLVVDDSLMVHDARALMRT